MPAELWFEGPGRVALREAAAARAPGPGEVVARAIASGVSRGTELLLYAGEGPEPFDPSLGATTYPCRYGYAWVGEITRVGPGVALAPGQRVFALAPHGEELAAEAAAVRAVPAHLPPARVTLAANLETALTCVWDARVGVGDRALVLGAGVVGLLAAHVAAKSGAAVTVVEPSARRREAALALGAHRALPDGGALGDDFDAVIEATGRPETLARAIALAAVEARVVVASFYGRRVAEVPLGEAFHRRRLQLVSSQVSRVPPERAPRWDARRRFAVVLDLLADERLDAIVDAPRPFASAPEVYRDLAARPGEGLHAVLAY